MHSASIASTHGERVRRLERRDDPLGRARAAGTRSSASLVGARDVLGAAGVAQVARARARRPGSRARPRSSAPRGSARPRRRGSTRARRAGRRSPRQPPSDARPSPASTPIRSHLGVVDEGGEDADRVGAAADAGDHRVAAARPRPRASARAPRRRSPRCRSRTSAGYGAGPTPSRSRSGSSRRSRPSRGSPRWSPP